MSNDTRKIAAPDIRRIRDVAVVLIEEGLSFVVDGLKIHYLLPASLRFRKALGMAPRREAARLPPEVRLRRALERLGPTYVKLGQILSTRPDIVPPEYVAELSKLQDAVAPVPSRAAIAAVESELGRPIKELFRTFEAKPLAAASLAQVHRAVMKDGTEVAVKVKRPGIDDTVRTDIRIIGWLALLIEERLPEARKFRPAVMAREFAEWTLRELDFEAEGANIERFSVNFADEPAIVLPKVIWPHTTRNVLTATLVKGVKIDDSVGLRRRKIDRKKLASVGLRAGFRMFFIDGFFHADPHPGNLVALPPAPGGEGEPEPRLGIFDFGMVGWLSESIRYEMVSCFLSFIDQNLEGYIRHILDLADSTEGADTKGWADGARVTLTGVLHKPTSKKCLGFAFYEVLLSGARHGIRFSRELILVGKALFTLETIGLKLNPDIDLAEEMRPFLNEVLKREFNPVKLMHEARDSSFDTLYMTKHLPEMARLLFDRLTKGEVGVRIDFDELYSLKSEFDRENDIRVIGIMASALLIASIVAMGLDAAAAPLVVSLGRVGLAMSLAAGLWVVIMIGRRPPK
jgi:ubiquinone biosynthesis protein